MMATGGWGVRIRGSVAAIRMRGPPFLFGEH